MVIAALLLSGVAGPGGGSAPSGASSSGPLPAVTVSPPAHSDAATRTACAKLIGALPLRLAGQPVRAAVSDPSSPDIVAWGEPAIVLRCGVGRPASLHPPSTAQYFSATGQGGPFYDVTSSGDANVYTTVDRAVYIAVTIPVSYHAGPLPAVSRAIASVLPAVCVAGQPTGGAVPNAKLCVYRS